MSDTTSTENPISKAQITTAPECRDIFVDGVVGAMVRDGVVRINLVNTRYNFDGSAVEHAVVARMVMSRSGVRNLHAALERLMGRLSRSTDRGERGDDRRGGEQAPAQAAAAADSEPDAGDAKPKSGSRARGKR